jgi:hypothetical protein
MTVLKQPRHERWPEPPALYQAIAVVVMLLVVAMMPLIPH